MVSTLHGPVKNRDGSDLHDEALDILDIRGLSVDGNGMLYVAEIFGVYRVTQEDWDNDGIPDSLERSLGAPFVVGVDDRHADSDNDGFPNLSERIAGTNPASAASRPRETTMIQRNGDSLSLFFPMQAGGQRQLEFSDDMILWKPRGGMLPGTSRAFSIQEKASPLIPQRFYRVRQKP